MRKTNVPLLSALLCLAFFGPPARAQSEKGGIELTARITPSAARPEPVRQFTFYILTRSYDDVVTDVGANNILPSRDEFIDTLKVSKELKVWLKAHDILDLTMPNLDKAVTADDIITVPEFLLAYQHSNSGGVTNGIPKPRYKDADKVDHPDKYKKEYQEYLDALKKFIKANPASVGPFNAWPPTWRRPNIWSARWTRIWMATPLWPVCLPEITGSVRLISTPTPETPACAGTCRSPSRLAAPRASN